MRKAGWIAGAAALFLLAGCAGKPAPRPAPAPVPVPPPPSPPPPPPAPDWQDLPLSPGEWAYAAERREARFGPAGAGFTISCEAADGRIRLAREGGAGAMTVRTSSAARNFPEPSAALPASDPFLDAIGFSRGRFTVEGAGLPRLVIPAWPEAGRVLEDCRN